MSSSTIARRKQGKIQNGKHLDSHVEETKKCKENKMGIERKCCGLLSFHELPDYMKDNEFVVKYYRAEWPLKQALFSLFQWHNETINIWTHLIGFVLFAGLTVVNAAHVSEAVDLFGIFRTIPSGAGTNTSHESNSLFMGMTKPVDLKHLAHGGHNNPTSPPLAPRWPFYVYLAGSMFCLLSSTICHLFCCHSRHANHLLFRMDYVGITTMIITSFFPPIYYIFQCQPIFQFLYLSGITLFGLFTIATLLSSSNKCRAYRAVLFVSMGLFGLIPAFHACVLNWDNPKRNLTLAYESGMALSYLVGTGFYVSRIPERWRPGWFDLAGHSHQIFHVFVVLGALAHYGAALLFLEYRDRIGC